MLTRHHADARNDLLLRMTQGLQHCMARVYIDGRRPPKSIIWACCAERNCLTLTHQILLAIIPETASYIITVLSVKQNTKEGCQRAYST